MSQSDYFINKLSNQKLLYENPGDFLESNKQALINTVRDDMYNLCKMAMPVHLVKYGCDNWESWTDHSFWYYIKQDKKETVAEMLNTYYGNISGLRVPEGWDIDGKTIYEISSPKGGVIKNDIIFNCLRAVYFYENYYEKDKYTMFIPYKERTFAEGEISVDDFVECVDYAKNIYKIRYSRQDLEGKVNRHCVNIANRVSENINSYVLAKKRQTSTAKAEIAQAYAVLKKYGLMPNGKQYQ